MENYLKGALARNIERWVTPERELFFVRMSSNTHLTKETLMAYPNEKWCPNRLTRNPSFSFDWVEALPNLKWNWDQLSRKEPPMSFVLGNLDKPLDWRAISLSVNITFREMLDNKHLPWQIEEVLFTCIVTDDELEYLRHYRTRYDFQSWVDHSSRVSWSALLKSPDLPWVYSSIHPFINSADDLQFVRDHDPALWNWNLLSDVTPVDLILSNQDLPWNWHVVSTNSTVTYRTVVENPGVPWYYTLVPPEELDDLLARQWIAASHIKRLFRRAISDPSYKMCQKRLSAEFRGLENLGAQKGEGSEHVAERCSVGSCAEPEGH